MYKCNVRMPCMYGLPKEHKPDNLYRTFIVANYDSPTANISKWQCGKIQSNEELRFNSDSTPIENSLELFDKVRDLKLNDNEHIISFDKRNIRPLESAALFELSEVCINQSFFQFRGNFHRQNDGLAIGLSLSLSLFLCNLFMNAV